jgi:hypothetical protein
MGWRDVQAGVASGRINYAQKPDKFGSFMEGFASVYAPMMSKKQDAKLKAEAAAKKDKKEGKDRLKLKREEQEEENALYLKQAQQIARNVGFEGDAGTINYMFNQLVTFKGDATKVETNYQTGVEQRRITRNLEEFAGPVIPNIPRNDKPMMDRVVQGESAGDINALLIGEFDGKKTFFKTNKPVSQMTKRELLKLTEANGDYFNWSKEFMPPSTQAFKEGKASTPVGKYQFIGSTLRGFEGEGGLFEQLGITDDTVFDEKTQDKLFIGYAKQRLAYARSKDHSSPASGKRFERHILRKTWEFLDREDNDGNYLTSDEDVDKLIAEIDTGTADQTIDNISNSQAFKEWAAGDKSQPFEGTEGGYQENVITLEPMKPASFDLDFASIETKRDAEALIATINADNSIGEAEKNAALAQVQEFVKTLDVFDFAEFTEGNRITDANKAEAAILTLQNNKSIPADDLDGYVEQLTEMAFKFNRAAVKKAEAAKDPIAYFPVGDNGLVDLGSQMLIRKDTRQVAKEDGDEGEMVTEEVWVNHLTGEVVEDVDTGRVFAEGEAATMIKLYNEPISKASEIVQEGIGVIDNLLEYRQLVTENPTVMNTYLTAVGNLNTQFNEFGTALKTAFGNAGSSGVTYQEYESLATPMFEALGAPLNRKLFALQLRAAYDQARLMGSSGQGLSDRELGLNLISVGEGLTPKQALIQINSMLSRTLTTVENQRNGKIGSIIAQRKLTEGLQAYPYGQNFKTDYAVKAFTTEDGSNYSPKKAQQFTDALEGKTELNAISETEVPTTQTLEVTEDTLTSLNQLPEMVEKLRPFLGKTVEIFRDEAGQIQYREVTE